MLRRVLGADFFRFGKYKSKDANLGAGKNVQANLQMSVSDMESDIFKAVKAYLDNDSAPYAIALDGEWGVGKTHLVKSAVGLVFDAFSFLYVSLYGLSTIVEIESAILAAVSKLGEYDAGVLSNFLNANPELADGVRIGGLGYAVQFGLRKWRKRELDRAKSLTICFDDLERWRGDLGVCLGYINGLAEHEGAKCIVIGDLSKISDEQVPELQRARSKILRYVYKVSHKPDSLLEIALEVASIKDASTRSFVENQLSERVARIASFLQQIECQNIRLIADSLKLYAEVVAHNLDIFEESSEHALEFFEITLASIKLVQLKSSDDFYLRTLRSYDDRGSYSIMKVLGYHGDEGREDLLTDIEKLLLEKIFFRSDEIQVAPILKLALDGFYCPSDFSDSFSSWKSPEPYEYYIDTFKFWNLSDEESNDIFGKVISDLFVNKKIKNPEILLRISGRLTSDIKRGVVDLEFEKTKTRLRALFDSLYDSDEMEYVKEVGSSLFPDRYEFCQDLVAYVRKKNSEYLINKERVLSESVWSKISQNPSDCLELLDPQEGRPIFALYSEPKEVILALESLSNSDLFELTRWMGSRLDSPIGKPAVQEEKKAALTIADILDEKYMNVFSVRASHMKQISRILRNQSTSYDT